ncbi:MAG: hypothetical protein JWR22_4310 [Herminiimonas sp.]|nr:hypothetical protein [Herminiimonas sp.]
MAFLELEWGPWIPVPSQPPAQPQNPNSPGHAVSATTYAAQRKNLMTRHTHSRSPARQDRGSLLVLQFSCSQLLAAPNASRCVRRNLRAIQFSQSLQ